MIKANFKAYDSYVTDSLYQWDLNQVLTVTGLNLAVVPEVHFSNANMDRAIVRQSAMVNHVVSVGIPNSLLQDPLTIEADIGIYEGDTFKVVEKVLIPVKPKKRPLDYKIETSDEEIYSFEQLKNHIANMTTKAETSLISARIDTIIANANKTEGNSELVDIRVGADGKTYDSAGTSVRSQFNRVFNNLNALDNGKIDYNPVWSNGEITNSGDAADNALYVRTDFINISELEKSVFTINGFTLNLFFYDKDYNYVIRFDYTNNFIFTNARPTCAYVRLCVLKAYVDNLSIIKDTEFKKSVKNVAVANIKNLFDADTLIRKQYYDPTTQTFINYDSWSRFEFDNDTDENVSYAVYKVVGGKWVEYEKAWLAYVDENYNLVSYSNRQMYHAGGKLSTFVIYNYYDAGKVVISMPTADIEGIFVCKTSDIENVPIDSANIIHSVSLHNETVTLDSYRLINITKPYVEYDTFYNQYMYFKFNSIEFEINGKPVIYEFENVKSDGFSISQHSTTSFMENVAWCAKTNNLALDCVNRKIVAVTNIEKHHILLLSYDEETKAFTGALADYYRKSLLNPIIENQNDLSLEVKLQCDETENELYSLVNNDRFVFGYYGDAHSYGYEYSNAYDATVMAIDRVDKHLNLDGIICAGDSVLSKGDKYTALRKVLSKFSNRDKLIYCEGNHDRWAEDPILSRAEYFNLVLRHHKDNKNISLNDGRAYYYRDYPDKKIRIVVCTLYNNDDSNYDNVAGYDVEQMEWLANDALKISNDYHVIIVTHSAPIYTSEGFLSNTENMPNREVFTAIIESFVNGTSVTIDSTVTTDPYSEYTITTDFIEQGLGNIVGVFTGHNHRDIIMRRNGINYISIACGYNDIAMYGTERKAREYSEIAFDIVILDTHEKTVTLKRFGFGNDREFTY